MAQLERALRVADERDGPALAPLHEGAAGEYALLDRWPEAEQALRTALSLRRELGDAASAGADLRLLSITLWRLCRGKESGQTAQEAVQVLEALPPGPELAWAYANLGASHLNMGQPDDAIAVIERARALGERLHRPDIVSYAWNAIGLAMVQQGQDGISSVQRALRIALDADLHEAAGRAYSSLAEGCVSRNRFEEAERWYREGMTYCEDRELGVFSVCLMGWRAQALLLTGQWDEAAGICAQMLGREGISPVNRLNPLRIMGTIRGRRDEAGAWELLDEALALAEGTGEPQWIVPVRAARAELRWLSGQPRLAGAEARPGRDHALGGVDPWTLGSVAIWLARLREPAGLPSGLPEPYALERAGDWPGAAAAWARAGRPYDAALAWLARRTRPGSGRPSRPWTAWAPGSPPLRSGGG